MNHVVRSSVYIQNKRSKALDGLGQFNHVEVVNEDDTTLGASGARCVGSDTTASKSISVGPLVPSNGS
jgi:hypothetical protein